MVITPRPLRQGGFDGKSSESSKMKMVLIPTQDIFVIFSLDFHFDDSLRNASSAATSGQRYLSECACELV